MACKLLRMAEERWRCLDGAAHLPLVQPGSPSLTASGASATGPAGSAEQGNHGEEGRL